MVEQLRFNRLTIIDNYYRNGIKFAVAICDCGKVTVVRFHHVKSGHTKSCGCLNWEKRKICLRPRVGTGKTKKNKLIRSSNRYKEWRKEVFERDNYTCQNCGKIGGKLNAHHIKEFCNYPELIFDLNNGQTLCLKCHKKTDNYGYKAKY